MRPKRAATARAHHDLAQSRFQPVVPRPSSLPPSRVWPARLDLACSLAQLARLSLPPLPRARCFLLLPACLPREALLPTALIISFFSQAGSTPMWTNEGLQFPFLHEAVFSFFLGHATRPARRAWFFSFLSRGALQAGPRHTSASPFLPARHTSYFSMLFLHDDVAHICCDSLPLPRQAARYGPANLDDALSCDTSLHALPPTCLLVNHSKSLNNLISETEVRRHTKPTGCFFSTR